jgi:hypothetical protein
MKINAFEIINLIIVLCFMLLIKRQRDGITLLLILFFYGSLHFSFGPVALATINVNFLNALHTDGGGMLAKLSTLLLLGTIFVLLSKQAFDSRWTKPWKKTKVENQMLLVMVAVACGYIFNFRFGDWMQLKNVISIEMTFAFLLVGYVALAGVSTYKPNLTYSWCVSGLVILFIADCIAFYEVFSQQSWAATPDNSGELVWRACSILFNPNLFAYWASLVFLGFAYGMQTYKNHRKMMLWGMVLASIAIYLSGSRSANLLLMTILFISAALMKEKLRWVPLIVLLLTMLTIYAGAEWLVTPFISNDQGWRKIALLGERFIVSPIYLISYILRVVVSCILKFVDVFGLSNTEISNIGISNTEISNFSASKKLLHVPDRIVESIDGRFVGKGVDSGWVVLYRDTGLLGLVSVIWAVFMLIAWGVKVHIARSNSSSIFALAILIYNLLIGFAMRFQIFPVWLFISIVIILCLAFWRQFAASTLKIKR